MIARRIDDDFPEVMDGLREHVANDAPASERRRGSNELVTEDSAAMIFAEEFEGRFRYCHSTGAWFEWMGHVWRKNETQLAFHWARKLARRLAADQKDRVRYVTSKTSFAAGVERFCRADPIFAVTADAWDQDPFLLGTPGGTVDLRTGRTTPGNPQDGITRLAAVAPAKIADCPRWITFLAEATGGDDGLIRFLQQWSGYSLTGDTREHALVFVHGLGKNGKSVFLNTITGILRDYAMTAAMDTFTASRSERHSTDVAMLRGARLVTASETEEGRAWAEAKIKQMTGGDPITARFMRQDNFTFRPAFKLTIVGNHKPVLHNVDDAARRRFNIVPFTRKPEHPDPQLEEKLKAEWPGVLRWMIDGCLDWQAHRLVRPEIITRATDEYFADQDLFGQWLDEKCDVELGNNWKWEAVGKLFESWSNYARDAGETPSSKKSFSENLQRRGFVSVKKERNTVRAFEGIRLCKQVEDER